MIVDPFTLPPDDGARYVGPFEHTAWPERLTGHVVSRDHGADRRIAGYATAADLARFHGIADVAWLALCGELPTAAQRAALDTALVLLAPVHIGEAPAHAAYLARMSGGRAAATVGVAGIGLAELADHERTTLAPWLAWLDAGDVTAPVPAAAQALDAGSAWHDVQAALAARMRGWFGATGGLPDVPLSRVACAHALLHRLGLRDALVVETLATWARLPAVIAEANHARAGGIRAYPARLPDYQYVDEQGASP